MPHLPQLLGSELVLLQTPLQRTSPVGQVHWLEMQLVPPRQRTPQPPQLALSLRSSTQAPPQSTKGLWQPKVQVPCWQVSFAPHTLPQKPQLLGSSKTLAQIPLQN